jgi:hypothetical protein
MSIKNHLIFIRIGSTLKKIFWRGGIEMKKFAAFVTAILFFILLAVPCFAQGTNPAPNDPKSHQPVTVEVVK